MADDPRPLLRELAASDRRGAIWCAALCAESVLHLVPPGEDRPRRAVRLALAYGRGFDVPAERLRAASDAAYAASGSVGDAAYAAYACATSAAADANVSVACATAAACAASAAADAAVDYDDDSDYDDAYADAYAVWEAARDAAFARLAALVWGQLDPIAPSPADVRRARPEAQVAWDWLTEHVPDPVRIGSLGEALDRARRLGLCWDCPVERAIAERSPLVRRWPSPVEGVEDAHVLAWMQADPTARSHGAP